MTSMILALGLCWPLPLFPQTPAWTLDPGLAIGEAFEPDYALSPVSDIAIDSTGRIFVGQPMDRSIRVYSADGSFLRTIGERGEGPGEIRNLSAFGLLGDSLWISDLAQERVTWFSLDGELLGTRRWSILLENRNARPGVPEAILSTGESVASPKMHFTTQSGLGQMDLPVYLLDPDLRVRRHLYTIDGRKRFLLVAHRGGRLVSSYQPLNDSPLVEAIPDGSGLVVLFRPAPDDETPHEFEVKLLDGAGDSVGGWQVRYSPRRVTAEERTRYVENVTRRIDRHPRGGPPATQAEELAEEALFLPDFHPPVTKMVIGRDGTIWLRRGLDAEREFGRWHAYSQEGRPLGTTHVPRNLRVEAATENALWATRQSEAGVPRVLRLDIRRE